MINIICLNILIIICKKMLGIVCRNKYKYNANYKHKYKYLHAKECAQEVDVDDNLNELSVNEGDAHLIRHRQSLMQIQIDTTKNTNTI